MTDRKKRKQSAPRPQPETPKVLHSPGGIRGRWMMNSLSFVLVILAAVMILISVGVSGYYYATVRDNLVSRAVTASDTFRKYFTDTYDQFYTQAESTVTTFSEQNKLEQQFLDANGRILLSTSGLSGGGLASTEDATQALATQKTSVFTGRDPLSDERVMSVTAPLLSSRGDLVGGVRFITSLRVVERQIWIIIGVSLLACLVFLIFVVASNSYFIRSIVDPVLKINNIAKEIAAGRYGVRLQKTYDDEIGELCDTINYMSDEINRAERMKNDFISSVSHELRTPLTALRGLIEPLRDGMVRSEEARMRYYNIILRETLRLSRLIDDLMELSRLQSGRLSLEQKKVDMSIIVEDLAEKYTSTAADKEQTFTLTPPSEQWPCVMANADRVEQILVILLDNAMKYTPEGGRITLSVETEGGKAMLRVSDTGVGIAEEDLPYVFDRFYKADKSHTGSGSGLGLSIAREILQQMGENIAVTSEKGKGSTFSFTLPLAASLPAIKNAPNA